MVQRFESANIAPHEVEHNRFIRENGAECALFLKRNQNFPVQPCSINLYGSGARRTIKGGKGSGDVNSRYSISVEEGLKNAGFEVMTQNWMDEYDILVEQSVKDYWDGLYRDAEAMGTSPYVLLMSRPKPPVSYAMPLDGKGELNIYVVARDTSEGFDRQPIPGDFELLDCEVQDILELASREEKFLLVLNTANVLDISPIVEQVDNILLLSQLGAETGNIFADILTGKANVSGKLSTTWGKHLADYPSTKNFGTPTEVRYEEGVYVGYRYFDSFDVQPQFPFGFGLSYTEFSSEPMAFSLDGNLVRLSVCVKNTGNFEGKETIQVYFSQPGKKDQPRKQLIAYAKTDLLQPGEDQTLELVFDMTRAAAYRNAEHCYVLEKGRYQLFVGSSLVNTVCAASVQIGEDVVGENVHPLTGGDFADLVWDGCAAAETPLLGEKNMIPTVPPKKETISASCDGVSNMSIEEMAKLCVGVLNDMTLENNIGNSGKLVAGSAGETYSDERIAPLVLADGTAGLRLSPSYQTDENGRVIASMNAMAGMLPGGVPDPKGEIQSGKTYYQYCTAIPVGTALAQSWNDELCQKMGALIGREMVLFGVDFWLAPAMNIHRNPLCGRNFEYYSEDPLLSGRVAAAITKGVQSNPGRYVTIKHFCCNNQETDRFFCDSIVNVRALREIYLKGFEICVKEAKPGCVMTSYNLVNGTHTANSVELLQQVLRQEWGYDGLIVTDWLATGGMGSGVKYGPSKAWGCIAASNDLIMPGRDEDLADILQAVERGELTRKQLALCAARVLRFANQKA